MSETCQWVLVQTKPNAFAVARENLLRQGFGVFLPLIELTQRRGMQFITNRKPLFPGYVFVDTAPAAADIAKLDSTRGVSRIVRFGDNPAMVPANLVNALRQNCDSQQVWQRHHDFSEGSTVLIESGPFSNFVGRVDQIESEARVHLLIDLLGKQTRLTLNANALSKVGCKS